MTTLIKGIAASSGISIGKAFRLVEPVLSFEEKTVENPDAEIERFRQAVEKAKNELNILKSQTEKRLGKEQGAIFEAHLLVLSDPEFVGAVEEKIKSERKNAEAVLDETAKGFIHILEKLDNEYMRERTADIRDVTKRLMAYLLDVSVPNPGLISEEVIIVAKDLTPSDTAQLDRKFVKGFTTDIGGRTSHSAIMARSLEIPAVVGTKTATETIQDGDLLILDGLSGEVYVNPTEELLAAYKEKQKQYEKQLAEWRKLAGEPTVSSDGHRVELAANIGSPKDVKAALANGAEGVGLFRTEFLYMDKTELPSEEEQFEAYKAVLEGMKDKPVIIRTLDIGGDKELPYFSLPKEM
ncbi:phosphoenolpyruvate--protein phosphotransferase, partial [Caldibacillus debilis]|uniref:phosphoenolpyruvate--protein phosphotransferase n=1 Tax=Caldibacillus debilis TaxID=301148 RepID=UPI000B56C013